jgi:triosephosphate isomerase
MSRKKFVAGNWKMFTNASTAKALAEAVVQGVADDRVSVAVCPPFPYLSRVGEALKGGRVVLGAQNCYHEKEGAFTGEVSPVMLVDVGVKYVILGHSERRHVLGETDTTINRKIKLALDVGLHIIFCVGEKLDERQANNTEQVLQTQLVGGLEGLTSIHFGRLVIAYEPVWAIGTGHTATPDQAQSAHAFIRRHIATAFGQDTASALLIQYGGSVKADNAGELMRQPDVDGALVGGASLKADQFLAIVKAAS